MAATPLPPIQNWLQSALLNEIGLKPPPQLSGLDLTKPVQWALRPEDLQKPSDVSKYLATNLVTPDPMMR
jgi:hypothetical protein